MRLSEIVDWDSLEEGLQEGLFKDRKAFKNEVRAMFDVALERFSQGLYTEVIAGLFPEYREKLNDLPWHLTVPCGTPRLTWELVRTIRAEHSASAGERGIVSALGRKYGVKHNTISDIIHRRTWREEQAA